MFYIQRVFIRTWRFRDDAPNISCTSTHLIIVLARLMITLLMEVSTNLKVYWDSIHNLYTQFLQNLVKFKYQKLLYGFETLFSELFSCQGANQNKYICGIDNQHTKGTYVMYLSTILQLHQITNPNQKKN